MKIIDLMSHRSGFCTPENFYVDAVKADNLEELMENMTLMLTLELYVQLIKIYLTKYK